MRFSNERVLKGGKVDHGEVQYDECDPGSPRKNKHADSLATLASVMTEDILQQIKVKLIAEPSISTTADYATKVDVAAITTVGSCWMDPIIEFLTEDRIPDDESKANKIRRIASRYWLSADRKL